MRARPEKLSDSRIVVYDEAHWDILSRLRKRAIEIMALLDRAGIESFVYGSVARGDTRPSSDIDIIIPKLVSSYRVELAVGPAAHREVVQATPSSVLKAHIHLTDDIVITFPLFKMWSRELDFYKWGGLLSLKQMRDGERVPGVDKRLLLIEPTIDGHIEHGVVGRENQVSKTLKVSIDIAKERVRVLMRRSAVGRTGIFLVRSIPDDSTFEKVASHLRDSIPALRRTIERRGG